jgi:hypothetical protein
MRETPNDNQKLYDVQDLELKEISSGSLWEEGLCSKRKQTTVVWKEILPKREGKGKSVRELPDLLCEPSFGSANAL